MFGSEQSGFTIVAPVASGQEQPLRDVLNQISADVDGNEILPFGGLPLLHYAAFAIVPVNNKPMLLFEGNIDGDPPDFLAELTKERPSGIDAIFANCAGFKPDSRLEYISTHNIGAGTFYVGCPGRSVEQIKNEQTLRQSIESFLADDPPAGTGRDQARDYARTQPPLSFAFTPYEPPTLVRYGLAILIVSGIVLAIAAICASVMDWDAARMVIFVVVALAILAVAFLRHLESRDQPFANRSFSPATVELEVNEDLWPNNHMVSVTTVKPGLFRAALVRVVFLFVSLSAKFIANKGQLSGIASIHFARWVILERNTVVFLSNFGGSWESYLNDFIDLGASGLTAVWSNVQGFPRARFLVLDGARQARAFKIFARNSMVPTLVWYQAYPDLTTINIDTNPKIREGLIESGTQGEAEWIALF